METNILRYQILAPDFPLSSACLRELGGVLYTGSVDDRPGLLYVEPDRIKAVTSTLKHSGVRALVIPDYVFSNLTRAARGLGLRVVDVEMSGSAASRFVAKHLIEANDFYGLYNYLDEVREKGSITAICLAANQTRIKLHGSGLIVISGSGDIDEEEVIKITRDLTSFLLEDIQDSKPTSSAQAVRKNGAMVFERDRLSEIS